MVFHDELIDHHARLDEGAERLRTISGVWPIAATAIVTTIGDGKKFSNSRAIAAHLGDTPPNNSSGGKGRLGGLPKKGGSDLRRLLMIGRSRRF